MNNKIIESTIEKVVDESQYSFEFKTAFKQYVKNKFEDNATDSDLKRVLSIIDVKEDGSLI